MTGAARTIILGCGGHASVVAEAARTARMTVDGYVSAPDSVSRLSDLPHLGADGWLQTQQAEDIILLNGIGGTPRRDVWSTYKAAGFRFATLQHANTTIAPNVVIGEGAQIMAGAIVQPGGKIGRNAIINTSASVDHDATIDDHVHVAPGAILAGGVRVGTGSFIGAGAVVIDGIRIGANVFVAAGSVVVSDVSDGQRIMGVPARPSHAIRKENS
jgi:UDP-perosamine 4-acetyltransferase